MEKANEKEPGNKKKRGKGRTFNFVNSIKGGCGKTTFSIFLTKYLCTIDQKVQQIKVQSENQNNEENPQDDQKDQEIGKSTAEQDKCLIFDMDFQGTSMENLFWESHKDRKLTRPLKERKYLNEAVRAGGVIDNYIVHNPLNEKVILDVIFADSDVKEKDKLRITPKMGYSPVVQYNVFRGGLLKFLYGFKDLDYKHFIFDMPPNSDGYSSAAMECVMNVTRQESGNLLDTYKIRAKDDVVNLFFMTGLDPGQIMETVKEVAEQLRNRDKMHYDNLFIVLNDNIFRETETAVEIGKDRNVDAMIEYLRAQFGGVGLEKEEFERIYILYMPPQAKYSTYCITGHKLNGLREQLKTESDNIESYLPLMPYNKIATYSKNFQLFAVDHGKVEDLIWLKETILEQRPRGDK